MQGFGASGAWWPNDLIDFESCVQEQSRRPAVWDEWNRAERLSLQHRRWGCRGYASGPTPETFLVSPGVYDWSRDPWRRRFLRMAAERGVPILIGFVNSAPPSGRRTASPAADTSSRGRGRLRALPCRRGGPSSATIEGITLSYVSPMNEPDYHLRRRLSRRHGCPVEQRAPLIQALGQELAARAPYCRVIADESSRTGEHFLREARAGSRCPDTSDYVAALAHHRYDFPERLTLELARELAEQRGKPLWSTEVWLLRFPHRIVGPAVRSDDRQRADAGQPDLAGHDGRQRRGVPLVGGLLVGDGV